MELLHNLGFDMVMCSCVNMSNPFFSWVRIIWAYAFSHSSYVLCISVEKQGQQLFAPGSILPRYIAHSSETSELYTPMSWSFILELVGKSITIPVFSLISA